jgi:hypothetical protein
MSRSAEMTSSEAVAVVTLYLARSETGVTVRRVQELTGFSYGRARKLLFRMSRVLPLATEPLESTGGRPPNRWYLQML